MGRRGCHDNALSAATLIVSVFGLVCDVWSFFLRFVSFMCCPSRRLNHGCI